MENGKIKAYGAGIASSIGECEHFASKNSKFEELDPWVHCKQSYPIQTVQPVYYYSKSLEEALNQVIKFGESLAKHMSVY